MVTETKAREREVELEKLKDRMFTILDLDTGHTYLIYRNGEIEGFPKHCLIINNASEFEAQAVLDFRANCGIDEFGRPRE